uniref:Secretory leukocyte peptidase inhibitor n=1 Tax=Pelusios castaneus TaxID=367368 RepID=A0A8C8RJZ8_9SAUR
MQYPVWHYKELLLPGIFLPAAKLGTCPSVAFKCKMINPPNRCVSDSQCPGAEKCCDLGCGMGCVPTQKVTEKPGTCPLIPSTCRMLNPPNKCQKDSECPDTKKCCMSICGKECLQPNQGTARGHYF